MAEYVMRHLVREAGLEHRIVADSAAATRDALGWGVHRKTQAVLKKHGIPCGGHRATLFTPADYQKYDLIVGMDHENRYDIMHILRKDPQHKVHLLLDWTDHPRQIEDPWYTDDYDTTFSDVLLGCKALLASLVGNSA